MGLISSVISLWIKVISIHSKDTIKVYRFRFILMPPTSHYDTIWRRKNKKTKDKIWLLQKPYKCYVALSHMRDLWCNMSPE